MKKLHCYSILFILLLCGWMFSCTDEPNLGLPIRCDSVLVNEAKDFISQQGTLSLPDMGKSLQESTTRSQMSSLKYNPGDVIPDWNTLQTDKDGNYEVWMFLLKTSSPLSGMVCTRMNGKRAAQATVSTSKLVIWKNKDKLMGRVLTYIPERKFVRVKGNDVAKLGFEMQGTNFSGICLVSSLDGTLICGQKYDEGILVFNFRPRKHDHKTADDVDNVYDEYNERTNYRLFFELFTKGKSTRAVASYSQVETDGLTCSFCGKDVDDCDCVEIVADHLCPRCGEPDRACKCCWDCWNYPCQCEGNGGSTGGSATGGSATGGSGTGGSTNIKTSAQITAAASNAVKKVLADNNNDTSKPHCNEGVRNAFNALYDTKELNGKTANDIIDHMKRNPLKWIVVQLSQVQSLANQGHFIVAGWKALSGSGHVCVIVPGTEANSPGWGGKVPMVMDTGRNMRTSSQPLSKSFGKEKKSGVVFYKYK